MLEQLEGDHVVQEQSEMDAAHVTVGQQYFFINVYIISVWKGEQ